MTTQASTKQFGARLAEASRNWRNIVDKRLQPLGFSQAGWLILLHLFKNEEGLTQSELANRIGITPASMSAQIERLHRDGWVQRRSLCEDRRCNRIQLADRGQETAAQIMRTANQVRDELLEGLPNSDIKVCEMVLKHIVRRAEELLSDMSSSKASSTLEPKS